MNSATLKLHDPLKALTQPHDGDVGWDIKTPRLVVLYPGVPEKIDTGIVLEAPEDTFARIESRSGLGSKGVIVLGGIIDPRYRGHLIVCLCNVSNTAMTLPAWNRIAQLVFYLYAVPLRVDVDYANLSLTDRVDGFGSTGAN